MIKSDSGRISIMAEVIKVHEICWFVIIYLFVVEVGDVIIENDRFR